MKISIMETGKTEKDSAVMDQVVDVNLDLLGEVVCKHLWSPSVFKIDQDGKMRRRTDSFESSDVVAIDIDEGLSIADAIERLNAQGFGYVIGTTRHHQKEKNGKPACDRYRIVLMLEQVVESGEQYKSLLRRLREELFPELDKSCIDSARFFFPCISIEKTKPGKKIPVDFGAVALEAAYSPPVSSVIQNKMSFSSGPLHPRTYTFLLKGAENGSWNDELSRATRDMKINGVPQAEAIELLEKATHGQLGYLDENDLSTINYVYDREATRITKQTRYLPANRVTRNTGVNEAVEYCFDFFEISFDDQRNGWSSRFSTDILQTEELITAISLALDSARPQKAFAAGLVKGKIFQKLAEHRKGAIDQLKKKLAFRENAEKTGVDQFIELICGPRERNKLHSQVLRHFIWQVKRKLNWLPVDHHMMPVFVGPQGLGKSEAINKLLMPLEGYIARPSNVSDFLDSRNFRMREEKYVAFLEEMAKAKNADMNEFKRVVSGSKESNRVLGVNASAESRINVTFIGNSNLSLAEILNDPTGVRRFWEIETRKKGAEWTAESKVLWNKINGLDYLEMWQSVDENVPSPIVSVLSDVHSIQQAELRKPDPVEVFVEELTERLSADSDQKDWETCKTLYEKYRVFCENSGEYPVTKHIFGRRLIALGVDANKSKNKRKYALRLADRYTY